MPGIAAAPRALLIVFAAVGLALAAACDDPPAPTTAVPAHAAPSGPSQRALSVSSTQAGDAIDIGNLGYGFSADPLLNSAGDVAGTLPVGPNFRAARWSAGSGLLEDLGTISSDCTISVAEGMNAAGAVVGTVSNCSLGGSMAFIATPGQAMRQLTYLDANNQSVGLPFAYAINDAGVVAALNRQNQVVRWTAVGTTTSNGIDVSTSGLALLNPAGRMFINAAGTISGQLNGIVYPGSGANASVGFIWEAGGLRAHDLGSLGGLITEVDAMNNAGTVVGRSWTTANQQHAFRWTSGAGMEDLGTLGGPTSWARAVNDAGEVVGLSELPQSGVQPRAFRWTQTGGMQEIPLPPGRSDAFGINSKGVITGELSITTAGVTTTHAFRWSASLGYEDLGALETLGGTESRGRVINDAGQVGGVWFPASPTDAGNHGRYARWTPANHSPSAAAGGPYTGTEGTAVTFSAAGSSDSDDDALTYSWDFGDGSPLVNTTTASVTHTYVDNSAPATPYVVTLTTTDGRGGSDADTTTASIVNSAPVVSAGADASSSLGTAFTLSAAFSDAGVSDGPWSYSVDWNDGTTGTTGTLPSQATPIAGNHTFAAVGTYTVTLRVTDKDGAIGSDQVLVTVRANRAPTALATGPASGVTGQLLTFSAAGSSDPDGDVLTYSWNMGNGVVRTGASVNYAYSAAGTFTVTLTVTDPFNASSSATLRVRIGVNTAPVVAISEPSPQLAGSLTTMRGVVTDPDYGPAGLLNVEIDWGDQTSSRVTAVDAGAKDGGITFSATHTYTILSARYYTATARVTDGYGAVGTSTTRMTAATPVRFARTSYPGLYKPYDGSLIRISTSRSYFIVYSSGTRSGMLQVVYLVRGTVTVGDNTGFEAPASCYAIEDLDADVQPEVMCSVAKSDLQKAAPAGGVLTLNGMLNGPQYSNMPVQGRN